MAADLAGVVTAPSTVTPSIATAAADPRPSSSSSRPLPTLTRTEIAQRITRGQALFIHRGRVVNATAWVPIHPGGALAILHFVGRDATDELEAFHPPPLLKRVDRFVIGRVDLDPEIGWRPLTPPIALGLIQHPDGVKGHWKREGQVTLADGVVTGDESTFSLTPEMLEPPTSDLDLKKERQRSVAYQELKQRVVDAGLFERPGPLAGYGKDMTRYTALGLTAFGLFFL